MRPGVAPGRDLHIGPRAAAHPFARIFLVDIAACSPLPLPPLPSRLRSPRRSLSLIPSSPIAAIPPLFLLRLL